MHQLKSFKLWKGLAYLEISFVTRRLAATLQNVIVSFRSSSEAINGLLVHLQGAERHVGRIEVKLAN